ncbi:MAG TPA: hypothetical protein VF268_11000, partial [Gammaproteobacteria bacterium]
GDNFIEQKRGPSAARTGYAGTLMIKHTPAPSARVCRQMSNTEHVLKSQNSLTALLFNFNMFFI